MGRLNSNGSSVTDIVGVMPAKSLAGGTPRVYAFPELSGSETFLAGEMVCLSGVSTTRTGLTKPGTDASGFGILGFAADNASGVTSGFKGVWIASAETVFVGNVGHISTSSTGVTAALDVGRVYGLTSISGKTYIDKSKTAVSTVMCRVLGLYEADSVGTFWGREYFTVLAPNRQLDNAWMLNTSSPYGLAV